MNETTNIIIGTVFSLNMIPFDKLDITLSKSNLNEIKRFIKDKRIHSIINSDEMAYLYRKLLEKEDIKYNKKQYTLGANDILIIGHYNGPRLKIFIDYIPNNSRIDWWIITRK